MIQEAISFLRKELNNYFNQKLGNPSLEKVICGNISKAFDGGDDGSLLAGKTVVSLINVEEDTTYRQQEKFTRNSNGVVYRNPKIHLNLYVLFAVNTTQANYEDGLRRLSLIIQFFQHRSVFDAATSPELDPGIEKLLLNMHSISFEQLNHLWGVLGGKYLPSVMYKVRQVVIDEEATLSEGGLIKEIQINDRVKTVISS
jgi:hypothetical protein